MVPARKVCKNDAGGEAVAHQLIFATDCRSGRAGHSPVSASGARRMAVSMRMFATRTERSLMTSSSMRRRTRG
jgi:hypothetical protein